MGLKLKEKLNRVESDFKEVILPERVRTIPDNEVQQAIERVCFNEMHYDDFTNAIGKLTSGGISFESLIDNAEYFNQFISPGSCVNEKGIISIIKGLQKSYPNQVGTKPQKSIPADCFSLEVYRNLPYQLREIVELIYEPRKRDVLLTGMLVSLSAAFGRYRFMHGSGGELKEYSPHLFAFVVGAAASGKGMMRYGEKLVEAITIEADERAKKSLSAYKQAIAEYQRIKKDDKKGEIDLEEPEKPNKIRFQMSASDTTQAALVEILYHNPIGGFATDSEADTLVQGNSHKDFGGFSDILRKGFHHESLSRQRRGDGESYIVKAPRIAFSISGTTDQLKKLITSEQNGLFSRFWFYIIPYVQQNYLPPIVERDEVGEKCDRLKNEVLKKADLWCGHIVPIKFKPDQERELVSVMQDKLKMEDAFGGDIGASWLRMGLIVKRIAVTLTALQGDDNGYVPNNCWRAAIAMIPAIKAHCIQALNIVRENKGKLKLEKEEYDEMKKDGKKDKEICAEFGVSLKTLQRRKDEWTNGGVHPQTQSHS